MFQVENFSVNNMLVYYNVKWSKIEKIFQTEYKPQLTKAVFNTSWINTNDQGSQTYNNILNILEFHKSQLSDFIAGDIFIG